ncbi:MAG: hypothetical protein EOM50_16690 [Erysipelotrichia bacterium]|nr:hypothetical protein [Erysipelotrichia bacterium]
MHPSLQNISAMMFVLALFILSLTQLDTYMHTRSSHEAKEIIIKSLAKECQEIKVAYQLEDTFENTSQAIVQMLGAGIDALDEETYLALLSFCYAGKQKQTKDKI